MLEPCSLQPCDCVQIHSQGGGKRMSMTVQDENCSHRDDLSLHPRKGIWAQSCSPLQGEPSCGQALRPREQAGGQRLKSLGVEVLLP